MANETLTPTLIEFIRDPFRLDWQGIHGAATEPALLHEHGPGYLDHFNTDKGEQAWYFDNVLKALEGNVPERLSRELGNLLDEFRELA